MLDELRTVLADLRSYCVTMRCRTGTLIATGPIDRLNSYEVSMLLGAMSDYHARDPRAVEQALAGQ